MVPSAAVGDTPPPLSSPSAIAPKSSFVGAYKTSLSSSHSCVLGVNFITVLSGMEALQASVRSMPVK